MDLRGDFTAHIAIVPGFVDDTGIAAFFVRIAKDPAVSPAVFHQPFLGGHFSLGFVQIPVAVVHNVNGKAQMMLAGAGDSDGVACKFGSLFQGVTVLLITFNPFSVQVCALPSITFAWSA